MRRKNQKLLYLLLGLCLSGAAACGIGFWQERKPYEEAEQLYTGIRESVFETQSREHSGNESGYRGAPDWEVLQAWNPDICAWIYSPGTDIDYPVVQGTDNDFYLNHTVNREKSVIGSIFLESRNDGEFRDDVSVLYGHHIRGGRMFSSLSGYKKPGYYEQHPLLYLYTPQENYQIRLFAGNVLDGADGQFPLTFAGDEERKQWLEDIQSVSTFQPAKEIKADGDRLWTNRRILALCTCSYEYSNARYAVYGLMEIME